MLFEAETKRKVLCVNSKILKNITHTTHVQQPLSLYIMIPFHPSVQISTVSATLASWTNSNMSKKFLPYKKMDDSLPEHIVPVGSQVEDQPHVGA